MLGVNRLPKEVTCSYGHGQKGSKCRRAHPPCVYGIEGRLDLSWSDHHKSSLILAVSGLASRCLTIPSPGRGRGESLDLWIVINSYIFWLRESPFNHKFHKKRKQNALIMPTCKAKTYFSPYYSPSLSFMSFRNYGKINV
mgnify:CR=1 FL=1